MGGQPLTAAAAAAAAAAAVTAPVGEAQEVVNGSKLSIAERDMGERRETPSKSCHKSKT
jgi:hypothetical protein